jgi:hypothetical protein
MPARASLSISGDLDPARLAELTERLAADLNRGDDVNAAPVTRAAVPGERGGAGVALGGQLALTFLTSGAAAALFAVIKEWFGRDDRTTLTFESGGTKLSLTARDLTPERLAAYVRALDAMTPGGAAPGVAPPR